MFQSIFNELSAAEISALPKKLQLELLAEFQILPEDLDHLDSEKFGVIERDGKKLYRYRAKDYRIYFAMSDETPNFAEEWVELSSNARMAIAISGIDRTIARILKMGRARKSLS